MADPQYDQWRDFEGPTGPEGAERDPDEEPPESSEDRYRDVINAEAERLPPEVAEPIFSPMLCPECGEALVADGPESDDCAGCGLPLHIDCQKNCERCEDGYCSRCFIGELCSGCYDDLRSGEYRRGGVTREVGT